MVFDEIISEISDRLNLTSDQAKARIARSVNARYRRVTSGIGLITSRRTQVSQNATIGNQQLIFTGIEKVDSVIDKSSGKDKPLREVLYSEMHTEDLHTEPPKTYAIVSNGPSTVTIIVDCVPSTTFTLYADGIANLSTLSGSDIPAFSESFHDILVYGGIADEYRKMEKIQLARDAEADYEKRLSDLRMFIAKSAYLDIYQGKDLTKMNWWKDKFVN